MGRHHRSARFQRGVSLIDVLVGVVIALVAVLVIFQVYALSEQYRRNTTMAGDAQVTGLLSSFILGLQVANSGNGLAISAVDLEACSDPKDPNPAVNFAKSWRPVPLLIIPGAGPDDPDAFAVNYTTAPTIVSPALLISASAGKYQVQSPNGFRPRAAGEPKDLIVAIERAPFTVKGACLPARVDAVADSGACQGCVELSFTGAGLLAGTSVFNLGASDDPQKVLYDIDVAKGTLRSTRLVDDVGQPAKEAPRPLASNIVNMKLMYGIDSDNDGLLDNWVPATKEWAPDILMSEATTIAKINQIKAIRIGVIVRSDQFDKGFDQDVDWSMFEGAVSSSFKKSASPPGNWRYRVYETTIPLRNPIWNRQS